MCQRTGLITTGRAATAALLLSLAMASGGHAQESTTRGWNLGFHLKGMSLTVEDSDAQNGGGAGVHVGYGVNRTVTLFMAIDGAEVDVDQAQNVNGSWSLAQGDLGARFHFANALRSWVPYLEAAVGVRAVTVDELGNDGSASASFSGSTFTVGGGLAVYLKESLALDLNVRGSGGEFTNVQIGNVNIGDLDVDASSVRVGLGLNWWP